MPAPIDPSGSLDATPLYRQLAERLTAAITTGALATGDKLPSVRQAAREQSLSVSTVVQAYRHLEDARLIEARPKSGYFVAPPRRRLAEPETSAPPAESMPVDISSMIERLMQLVGDPGYISFGAACPAAELFAEEKLRRAFSQAALRHRAQLTQYPLVPGDDSLRRAVARRALAWGCTLDPRDIVLTNGCNDAVGLCLQAVTKPGDIVALESPTSFGFLQVLEALHLRALEIPTHPRHGLSVEALAFALQTQPVRAVMAVPTLGNPLGASMPLAERKRLAQLLAVHQVPLIEDAIYNDLAEREEHRRAVKSFDTEGLVMLCSSFSKTVAPGLRVGWVEAGRWTVPLRRIKTALSGGHTSLTELAMADLLTQPGHEPHLRRLRQAIARRVDEARALVADSFPRGTRVTDPPGGLMLWLELPEGSDSVALFRACLEERIVFAPGTLFSASERYRHCLRLSVGGTWTEVQQRALRRIGALAQQLLPRGSAGLALAA